MTRVDRLGLVVALALALMSPARAQKAVVLGVPDNLTGFDAHTINDTLSQSATRMMLQGLFGFDAEMRVVPVLAERYDVNPDATEYRFYLRKGVVFHDGTPFNAEAVKINFERLVNPANKLSRASLLSMVKAFEVVDEHTLTITLTTPFGALVNTLAHAGTLIHSPAALARHGKEVMRHPVGTGPFRFVSWQTDTLTVARNPTYWRQGYPKVESVTVRSVPENGARLAMLMAGEAQFIAPLPPELVSVAARNPKLEVVSRPSIVTWYVGINTRKPPFNDRRVRQALNYAVDKAAYAKIVWNNNAEPATSVIPPGLPFHVSQNVWPYDVARARALLAEAGLANGFETEIYGANNTTARRAMQFLQQQLADVGIRATITPMDAGTITNRVWKVARPEDATVRLFHAGWSASTGDPDWLLRPLLYSTSAPPSLLNVAYYANPAVDAAILAGLATADPDRRAQAYKTAQEVIWPDAPWIYLGVERLLAGQQQGVTGIHYLADRSLLVEEVDIP